MTIFMSEFDPIPIPGPRDPLRKKPPRPLPGNPPPPPASSRGSPSGVILLFFPGLKFILQMTSPEKMHARYLHEDHHDRKYPCIHNKNISKISHLPLKYIYNESKYTSRSGCIRRATIVTLRLIFPYSSTTSSNYQ